MRAWPPVRRRKRRKSQKMHFQEFWDSCAQNKTSESSKMHFRDFWESCAQNKTSEISKTALSGILGLLCAEQNVGNLKSPLSGFLGVLCAEQDVGNPNNCPFRHFGTPACRSTRRKYQKSHCPRLWDSCAHNKTSKLQSSVCRTTRQPDCRLQLRSSAWWPLKGAADF